MCKVSYYGGIEIFGSRESPYPPNGRLLGISEAGGGGGGLGSLKAKTFKGKLCNLGSDFQPKYFPLGGMDIFWDKTTVGNYYFQMSRN